MITIIDYGLGNIKAFANIYKKLGIEVFIANKAEDLKNATKLILPGVGHFDYAMNRFNNSGMREEVDFMVFEKKIPVIGICVGMQIMAKSSEEGVEEGLGWIDAEVKRLDVSSLKHSTQLPHMGWNDIVAVQPSALLHELESQSRFYFLHSYYFDCKYKENILAQAEYGKVFTCAVNRDNVYGVQFHPEKSHHYGIQLLQNFSNI